MTPPTDHAVDLQTKSIQIEKDFETQIARTMTAKVQTD